LNKANEAIVMNVEDASDRDSDSDSDSDVRMTVKTTYRQNERRQVSLSFWLLLNKLK